MLLALSGLGGGQALAGDDGLRAARDRAVDEAFEHYRLPGLAVGVIRDGEIVVDLWGGWRDEPRTEPWQRDTIVDFYSVGKALAATLVLQAVDRGDIALGTPLVEFWPEFAAGGKEWVTVADALSPPPSGSQMEPTQRIVSPGDAEDDVKVRDAPVP